MKGQFHIGNANFLTDINGNAQFVFDVVPSSKYAAASIAREIKPEKKYTINIKDMVQSRTLRQNNLFWALLNKLALAQSGGRTGDITEWDCYITMLEKYGSRFEYMLCLPEAVPNLKEIFRAIKEVETREYNGKKMVMCKCFAGSSKYDRKEMAQLIDGVFDELEMLGVADAEIDGYKEEWRELNKRRNRA